MIMTILRQIHLLHVVQADVLDRQTIRLQRLIGVLEAPLLLPLILLQTKVSAPIHWRTIQAKAHPPRPEQGPAPFLLTKKTTI